MRESLQVQGFTAGAVKAGIRGKDRLDVGLIWSEVPAAAAGVFTTNKVKAAPVLLDMEHLRGGRAQAIIVNSGVANACTGDEGMRVARETAKLVAARMGIDEDLVQVCSTGVIGEQLDLSLLSGCMAELASSLAGPGFINVARAMMTTDTVPKSSLRSVTIEGKTVSILGLAKGSGMIMPNMATMLAFLATDGAVSPQALQKMLTVSANRTFNAITVDGDTSTNDTVLCLANGLANNPVIKDAGSREAARFQDCLNDVCLDLALQVVQDGEGATKLITVHVKGARSFQDAERAARTVANSSLVKTACFGEDANWGRIIAAVGRSGVEFQADKVDISFDDVKLVENGLGLGAEQEERATTVLKKPTFAITVDLKTGPCNFRVYTCDFSVDYVKINADYRT